MNFEKKEKSKVCAIGYDITSIKTFCSLGIHHTWRMYGSDT